MSISQFHNMTHNGSGIARGKAPGAFLYILKLAKSDQAKSHELYAVLATGIIYYSL